MSARNQICICGHSFMNHTPEYNDNCDMCDCFEFEFGYDLTIRPQNDTANQLLIADVAMKLYNLSKDGGDKGNNFNRLAKHVLENGYTA